MSPSFTIVGELLKDEFKLRKERNPKYSLRAFARDLDCPPSRLSEVINGKSGISVKRALKFIERLDMDEQRSRQFELSVIAHCARNPDLRSGAKKELDSRGVLGTQLDMGEVSGEFNHQFRKMVEQFGINRASLAIKITMEQAEKLLEQESL